MAFSTREAEFAGILYPADQRELLVLLERMMLDQQREDGERLRAQGVFLPHGPYLYAAECAAATMAQVEVPDFAIIFHPMTVTAKHGLADPPPIVAAPFSHWQTPLGDVPIDLSFARAIGADITRDWEEGEHSAEVILPYLQMLNDELRVCIVGISEMPPLAVSDLARRVVEWLDEIGEDRVLLVAATDFHFGQDRPTSLSRTDDLLDPMERLNSIALRQAVAGGALMSGWQSVALMIEVCNTLGCTELVVAAQADSSEAAGDTEDVACYASGWIA